MAARLKRPSLGSRYVDAVQRRRDEACFLVWGIGFAIAARRGGELPVPDLLAAPGRLGLLIWFLVLAGVGLRFWAAGNLEKNRFDRPHGPYRLARHPLYLGTLLVSLGFFLQLGLPVTGLLLWLAMLFGIFVPVLRKEERELAAKFPRAYRAYLGGVPSLWPSWSGVTAAVATDRFTFERAARNYGLRALWFLALVPGLNAALRWCLVRGAC